MLGFPPPIPYRGDYRSKTDIEQPAMTETWKEIVHVNELIQVEQRTMRQKEERLEQHSGN